MLVNFTFKNFRSFRDEKTLSMEASAIKELSKSVIRKGAYKLLPAAVLYGANSSGKSNALFALAKMRSIVLDSVKLNPQDTLRFDPFKPNPRWGKSGHCPVNKISTAGQNCANLFLVTPP